MKFDDELVFKCEPCGLGVRIIVGTGCFHVSRKKARGMTLAIDKALWSIEPFEPVSKRKKKHAERK